MTRRIYFDSLWKKLLLAGGIGTTTLITFLFTYLAMTGAIEVTGYSEDTVCAGTIDNPCYAYINFTAKEDIFIYPLNHTGLRSQNVPVTFKPDVQDWTLYRSWGKGWRTIDLTKPWSVKVKYAIKFHKNESYQIRIKVLKNSPDDTIKWSFGSLDPTFLAVEKTDIITDSYVKDLCAYRTTCNPTDLEYATRLYPFYDDYLSKTSNRRFEVQEEYKYIETVIEQECILEKQYNKSNDTYTEVSVCVQIENKTPRTGLRWVSAIDYSWASKQCYKTRQCIERANNLDPVNTELHVPMFGYDLKEYTIITSSGYNQSIAQAPDTDTWNVPAPYTTTNPNANNKFGYLITPNSSDIIAMNLTQADTSTGDKCYIYLKSSGALLYTTAISSKKCVFTGITLTNGVDYYIVDGKDSGTWDTKYKVGDIFPTGSTQINIGIEAYRSSVGVWTENSALHVTFNSITTLTGLETVYGPYNSTSSFDSVNITSDCSGDSNNINISQNSTSFQETTNATQNLFGETINGFYNNVSINCGWMFLEVFNYTEPTPTVTALSPDDLEAVGIANQTFICNITSVNVSSMSLYINDTLNITNTSGANNINYTFLTPIPEGDTSWLCQGCNDYPTQTCINTTARTITLGFEFEDAFCDPYTNMDNLSWEFNTSDFDWDVNTFRFNTSGAMPTDTELCMYNISHTYAITKQLNVSINTSFTPTYAPGSILVSCYNTSNITTTPKEVDGAWDGTEILVNCSLQYINVSFNESDYNFNITWVIG